MTQTVKRLLRRSRALDLITHAADRGRVTILLYHGFTPGATRDDRFPQLMPVARFEEQIKLLLRYASPLRLGEISNQPRAGVVVTFDDGYASNYKLAFPVLLKYQLPVTIFLTTGFLDCMTPLWGDWLEILLITTKPCSTVFQHNGLRHQMNLSSRTCATETLRNLKSTLKTWPIHKIHGFLRALEDHLKVGYSWRSAPEALSPLTWTEVRTMQSSGLVSFGAHTVSHPILARCSQARQCLELTESKHRVEEEVGMPCHMTAYPNGSALDYTEETTQLVRKAGYRLAVTTEPGYNRYSDIHWVQLRRWGGDISPDDFSFLVSGGAAISERLRRTVGRGFYA
jgi:peptidoglycan/xylan/chitin deacetylase (PgdA/CDA1 family)